MVLTEHQIHIDGIVKEYSFFQISDSHLAYIEESDDLTIKERVNASIHEWTRNGILPTESFDEIIDYVERNDSDGLFLCGDMIDFTSGKMMQKMINRLVRLSTEVFYVSGNHEHLEDSVENHVEISGIELYYQATKPFWAKHFKEITIVGIDNGNRIISNQCIEFLEMQIALGKPILLVMHIPMYTEELGRAIEKKWGKNGSISYFTLEGKEDRNVTAFCDVVRKPDSKVVAIFSGHAHINHQSEVAPGVMQYIVGPVFEGMINKITLSSN